MIELGKYNDLVIQRDTRVGLFLSDESGEEVLLPSKFTPETFELGDRLKVFCYLDNEERPVATTQNPLITRDTFAALKVAEVNQFGAFLDWGLEKHLLVPFREQTKPMIAGQRYVVYCYLDPKSSRLVASTRLDRFLDNSQLEVAPLEEVNLLITRETELGFEVAVNNRHKGLVFRDQVFRDLRPGDRLTGYVKEIRPDQKLDITLQPFGYRKLEPAALRILEELKAHGGMLPLTDKSPPEAIRDRLQMSKKVFKKGIGILYRARKIDLRPEGIVLLDNSPGSSVP
jgi:predicted RNA-binding protein (virulence factor B family)